MMRPNLVWIVSLAGHVAANGSCSTWTAAQVESLRSKSQRCVVYWSQHKSGGRTMTSSIKSFQGCHYACDEGDLNRTLGRCQNLTPKCNEAGSDEADHLRILSKGFVQTMASQKDWSPAECAWITVSREPVSRLASALFYCRETPKDQLCGIQTELWWKRATMRDMADSWGNFLFRELLLHPALSSTAMGVLNKTAVCSHQSDFQSDFRATRTRYWQVWRRELEVHGCGDDPQSAQGAANLERVLRFVAEGGHFDVWGLLEEFQETMARLDCAVPVKSSSRGLYGGSSTWKELTAQHHVTHNSESHKDVELAAIAEARVDPYILDRLAADIRIYDAIHTAFLGHAQPGLNE